jgi:fumarate reductase iron-sulfur subunit
MTERSVELKILRYDPERDDEPRWQTYTVPYREDWVVLDAINYVKEELDRTLSYRWSCHMAVCGSCGVVINGEPALACHSFLRDYPEQISVEPLHNFPIERDLIVVMDHFIEKLGSAKSYLVPKEERQIEEGEYVQSPAELDRFKQYTACINCLLCYSACPQYSFNDSFIGPAALALAHRYNLDSRDVGRSAREDVVASNPGVWECSFVGACSEVCPKAVDPAAAIQQNKIASAGDYFMNFLMPWRKP